MRSFFFIGFILLLPASSAIFQVREIYSCDNGEASFVSYAPLEVIKGTSKEMRGAVNTVSRTFLFSLNVNSLHGFNSGLQREHFNENYLETAKYPRATFEGKFVEDINFKEDGIHEVRAKGILELHGVKQERILKGTIRVDGNEINIHSKFTVLLEDHNIKIPRVVYQKISPEIDVTINATLKPIEQRE
jgi:polyisoprenoid-binding protein YceI